METRERPHSDHAYGLMFKAAAERLRKHAPEDIARKAGVVWDAESSVMRVPFLNGTVSVEWPSCRLIPAPENWHALVLLHYLDLADGTPLLSSAAPDTVPALMSFRDAPDGMIRGGKFEFTAARTFERILRGRGPEEIRRAAASLGGTETAGKGDLCFVIPVFPRFPVYLHVWLADEDFPASGRLFLDRSAGHYLTIEDIVTVGEILLRRLEEQLLQ